MFFFLKSSEQSRIRSISFCGIAVFGTPKFIAMVFAPFWGLAPSWHHPLSSRPCQDKRCQVRQEFRGLLQLGQKCLRIQHWLRFFFLRNMNTTQIGVRIKCGFKLLRVDLTIFIQNMSIDFCNHVHLGVAGVALRCFQVTVIQLQLVNIAGCCRFDHRKRKQGISPFTLYPNPNRQNLAFFEKNLKKISNRPIPAGDDAKAAARNISIPSRRLSYGLLLCRCQTAASIFREPLNKSPSCPCHNETMGIF